MNSINTGKKWWHLSGGYISILMIGFIFFMHTSVSFGQEYGLGFAGQPNSKDRRTELDLNPDKYFSFSGEFEIAFKIRIRKEIPNTFGYICRIVDVNNNNVDLLFNGPKSNSLQVVYRNILTDISVPDPDSVIYREWKEIRMKIDLKEQSIKFITLDTTLSEFDIPLSGKIKIIFGRNNFNPVQTTDVPTMDIKDIKILKKDKCLYHFPLDELSGNTANDLIANKEAKIQNPIWIRPKHQNWEEYFSTILHGFAAIGFDSREEKVYMVGDEQLKIFSVISDSIQTLEYSSRYTALIPGSQVFYDTIRNRLFCYSIKNRTLHYFNFAELKWEELSDGPNIPERFWFHNKYYSSSDSVLYTFGGYSQHKYFNLVQSYDFRYPRWDTVQASGDVFHPRMHAAIGAIGDTVYILGGYGSTFGDQILNPQHYSDLMAFSLKEKKFIKKYDFDYSTRDIVFAHSMVFDSNKQSFYVLASSIYEYDSYLQLLKGSLSNPQLKSMANKIPYMFHNENSYSDLFYSKTKQKLIALALLADSEESKTDIKVFTISFPPFPAETDIFKMNGRLGKITWVVLILVALLSILYFSVRSYFRKGNKSLKAVSDAIQSVQIKQGSEKIPPSLMKTKKEANSILFFGGFQVINSSGEDITRKFSPLLKELFLLVFLYSVKDKGISVRRITEVLWFSMNARSAKNNRAVNIAKLKHLLSEIESCDLTRKTEYWQVLFDDSIVYSDYLVCHKLTNKKESLSKEDLKTLLNILKAGSLLENAGYEWLDEFKLECSNQITDVLMNYYEQERDSIEAELAVQIADALLIFDIMHEEAICIKCKSLIALGKHHLAKDIFNKFQKDYLSLYDEPYEKSFTDIIKL